MPDAIVVGPAYPNPFNISTVVPLELDRYVNVEVTVFNTLGQQENHIQCGRLPAGQHLIRLSGHSWASGPYFVHVFADNKSVATQRVILIK